MNTTVLYIVMVCASLLMAVLPFGVFMGIGSMVGLPSTDIRMLLAYAVILLIFAYGISLLSFTLIQKSSCGEVKNFKQVSLNSLISLGFHLGLLLLVLFVPWFRNIVGNLFSPEIDQTLRDSVGFGYYSFWATMFGVALGGTLSGSCATDVQTNLLPRAVQESLQQDELAGDETDALRG
jgi:hypothetical protein